MSKLPPEVTTDILCRLPVKSLLRFRGLSKQFCSLIDSPEFIKLHVNRSIETNSNLSLILSGRTTPVSFSSISWNRSIFSTSLDSLGNAFKLDHQFENSRVKIIGSCNGLIALKNQERIIALWNPSTKKHLILPKFWSDFKSCDYVVDGFGYDVASDDYKLVRIIEFRRDGVVYSTEVTVYSLKTNSSKRIKEFPYDLLHYCSGTLATGALHWLVLQKPGGFYEQSIIAFDLKSDEFYHMPLPPLDHSAIFIMCMEAFRGCLCLSSISSNPHPCTIWVRNECGVKESWTELFSFPLEGQFGICDFVRALAYTRSCDKVLVDTLLYEGDDSDDWKLYWYDLENHRAGSSVEINGVPPGSRDTIICLDSLVSLDSYTGLVVQSRVAGTERRTS